MHLYDRAIINIASPSVSTTVSVLNAVSPDDGIMNMTMSSREFVRTTVVISSIIVNISMVISVSDSSVLSPDVGLAIVLNALCVPYMAMSAAMHTVKHNTEGSPMDSDDTNRHPTERPNDFT